MEGARLELSGHAVHTRPCRPVPSHANWSMFSGLKRLHNRAAVPSRSIACRLLGSKMVAARLIARPMISPKTSYRLDDRNDANGTKQGDEQEVTLDRRKTTTKPSQRRKRDQLPNSPIHSAVHKTHPRDQGVGPARFNNRAEMATSGL
jgi:hypothetical protein